MKLSVLHAKKAGFDAVNLHFANVTLIMDFISPYTNVRSDGYGGSWENRMRLPCEIVQAAKAAAGKDYPLIARIPADQGLGEAGIQMEALGVKIRLNTEVTMELVERMRPDAVVVATGASTKKDIPGTGQPIVVTEDDAFLNGAAIGKRVVVLGGAFWDVETAISLADQGKDVTLVREEDNISIWELGLIKAMPILTGMLQQKNVMPLFLTKVRSIEKNGVTVIDAEGNPKFVEADTVVLSRGRSSNRKLAEDLQEGFDGVHEIGDCVRPKCVADAVYGGRVIGARI